MTHVVRAIAVGAFALAAVSSDGGSAPEPIAADGEREACKMANDGDARPPSGCQGPVQVELLPVVGTRTIPPPSTATAAASSAPSTAPPAGPPAPAEPRCASIADCTPRCNTGSAASCLELGSLYLGDAGAASGVAPARYFFLKACVDGSAQGCTQAARLFKGSDEARATELFRRGCADGKGDPDACAAIQR